MLPLQGIGQGAQPIMSYNYGARNIDRMKKTFKLHLVISLIYSTLFWLFVQLFPATFAGIFSSDPELVSFTAGALRIYQVRCSLEPACPPDDPAANGYGGMLDHRGGCA